MILSKQTPGRWGPRRGLSNQNQLPAQYNSVAAPVDKLLPRLDKVRSTGKGRYIACCPGHDDKNPSLSIRELPDGKLLLKCWAGCGAADIVSAVGLELSDLFPPRLENVSPLRSGERWVPRDVLVCVAHEALVCLLAVDDALKGKPISEEDRDRVATAVGRLRAAAKEVGADV